MTKISGANENYSAIIKLMEVVAPFLPILYVTLSLINIFNIEVSISIFRETYEFWRDSTSFDKLHSSHIEMFIFSIIFVLPYIIVCIICIFSNRMIGWKRIKLTSITFILFLLMNYTNMDEAIQETCSDNWVKVGLVCKLQNIFMLLNVISFLLVCCAAILEIRRSKNNLN